MIPSTLTADICNKKKLLEISAHKPGAPNSRQWRCMHVHGGRIGQLEVSMKWCVLWVFQQHHAAISSSQGRCCGCCTSARRCAAMTQAWRTHHEVLDLRLLRTCGWNKTWHTPSAHSTYMPMMCYVTSARHALFQTAQGQIWWQTTWVIDHTVLQ